jgi:hypothetical protein
MKRRLLLILLLTIVVHQNAAAQDTNSNPNDLIPYDCGTVFWSIDESHNIRQWNLEGSTISGGQTILTAPFEGLSLSFGEIDNSPVFYSAGNGVYSIYHPDSGWSSFSTVLFGYGNSGGYRDQQYFLWFNGTYHKLYYYNGANDLNLVSVPNFSSLIGAVAVDSEGHAYLVDNNFNIRIYSHSVLLQSIPIINSPTGFNTYCAYGMFFINNILYYGSTSCGFYPNTLTPILINGSTAEIGTPISFACDGCTDLASCNKIVLAADSFQKNPVALYPNPGKKNIHINFDGVIEALEVYAVDGRQVSVHSNSGNTQIDISSLKSGVYYVGIQSNGKRFTQRFIKE